VWQQCNNSATTVWKRERGEEKSPVAVGSKRLSKNAYTCAVCSVEYHGGVK
jgi:hypothetical protein